MLLHVGNLTWELQLVDSCWFCLLPSVFVNPTVQFLKKHLKNGIIIESVVVHGCPVAKNGYVETSKIEHPFFKQNSMSSQKHPGKMHSRIQLCIHFPNLRQAFATWSPPLPGPESKWDRFSGKDTETRMQRVCGTHVWAKQTPTQRFQAFLTNVGGSASDIFGDLKAVEPSHDERETRGF